MKWQRLDAPGRERAVLFKYKQNWRIRGRIETVVHGVDLRVTYEVITSLAWLTRAVYVGSRVGSTRERLWYLVSDGRWLRGQQEETNLRGCLDVDLAITPATNTLPIRRLNVPTGGSAEIRAAWIRFVPITVQPLGQRYTRLTEHRYRYETDTGFSAEIDVDDLGLVTSYPGLWARA